MNARADWQDEFSTDGTPLPRGLDAGGFIRRRKWLILFGIALGVGLGYLYFSGQEPVYESKAQVLVSKQGVRSPITGGTVGLHGYESEFTRNSLATDAARIRSPEVIESAIEAHNLALLPSLRSGDAATALVRNLFIEVPREGEVLTLRYRGAAPEDCAVVLDAVIKSYQHYLGENQQNVSQETVRLIAEAKDVLLKQLDEKEKAYRAFRQEAPLLWTGEAGTNIHQSRLLPIETARSELLLAQSQTRALIEAIEAAIQRGGSREALMLMVSKMRGSAERGEDGHKPGPENQSFLERLFPLLLEEQMLLETHGPDHPKVVRVRKQIDMTRSFLQNLAPDLDATRPAGGRTDFLTVYLESLRQELQASREQYEDLNKLFDAEREAARALATFEVEDETYRNDIARTQALFESVLKRLEEISLIKDYGGYQAQLMSRIEPGSQVEPNLTIMLIASVLGLLFGVGLGAIVERADSTFHSPEEIRDRLGLPVVGHVPRIRRESRTNGAHTALDPVLCVYHRPKSREAEAFRAVRTSLYFSTRGSGQKVIQVTSPDPGDGKTTLATNLAVSIAQSGKRVLLLDADCRQPRVDKVFGLEKGAGLSSVITGEVEIDEAIRSVEVENLWVLPCGHRPPNPSELLTSPRFQELLEVLREKFDFVIVDTPPLLAVTDPSVVAARVDGVLLTVQVTKRGSVDAERATEMLAAVDARVLGVVVNGVAGSRGYYGYGSPSYGRRYGRYAGDGYGVDYGRYYDDKTEEPALRGSRAR